MQDIKQENKRIYIALAIGLALLLGIVFGEYRASVSETQVINERDTFWKHQIAETQRRLLTTAPESSVHTMTVWEDGSYKIVYVDGTSEAGCKPSGLCND